MAFSKSQNSPFEASNLPDFLLDPNAVLKDDISSWRYGRPPDYKNTRKVFAQTKTQNHKAGTLPELIENLVKNWEIEASFKRNIDDWRTIDKSVYTLSVNGGPLQSAEHTLRVGTYNAMITPNEYYSSENSDFNSSHKTFKRMMPTFAWELIEIYSGPPEVVFKWRHWGVMKNDYIGFNEYGEKVTAKAHGGQIDFEGLTIARLNDDFRLTALEIWFDPLEMFRQIAGDGGVKKEKVGRLGKYQLPPGEDPLEHLAGMDDLAKAEASSKQASIPSPQEGLPIRHHVDNDHARPASPAESTKTDQTVTIEEMSKMTPADCPFLMKWRSLPIGASAHGSEAGDTQAVDGSPWDVLSAAATVETITHETIETVSSE